MRLSVSSQRPLIEPRRQQRNRRRFPQAAHVAPAIFDRASRAGKGLLAGNNRGVAQSDSRQPRHRNRPCGYIPATPCDFESNSIRDAVAPRFMHLDHGFFFRLRADGPARAYTGPIKNSKVIQRAFGLKKFALTQRSLWREVSGLADERLARAFLSNRYHLTDTHLLMLRNTVGNVYAMRIIRMPGDSGFHFRVQISAIDVGCQDPAAVVRKPAW